MNSQKAVFTGRWKLPRQEVICYPCMLCEKRWGVLEGWLDQAWDLAGDLAGEGLQFGVVLASSSQPSHLHLPLIF